MIRLAVQTLLFLLLLASAYEMRWLFAEEGFFLPSEKPRECIRMEPDFPPYLFVMPADTGYRKILSYNGSLSGYWKVRGSRAKMEFDCYRLMGFDGLQPVWKVEKRQYPVFQISEMKRIRKRMD